MCLTNSKQKDYSHANGVATTATYERAHIPQATATANSPRTPVPDQLAQTLDLILHKMDMLTQTVSMLDNRISANENKINLLLQQTQNQHQQVPSMPSPSHFPNFHILNLTHPHQPT